MKNVLAVRDEYRMQSWAEIIRERQESGLTIKDYCAQHGISDKTFYYWLRKLRAAAAESMEPQLVRLDENRAPTDRMLHIRYGTAELTLPDDVDLKAVSVLLNALRRHD
jgi:transposase-like protein